MTAPASPSQGPGTGAQGGQRFGHVISHRPGPTAASDDGTGGRFLVRDDNTGSTYSFSSADIVTEGLRTARPGERVRFLIDHMRPGHASYIIRLDLPDVTEYYP